MRIQIYGQADSWWSNCNVTRGLAQGLAVHGAEVKVYDRALGEAWDRYVGDCTPGLDEDAEVGIYVGYAVQLPLGRRVHQTQVGALIAESSQVPASWAFAAGQCDWVICPSKWVADSYKRSGLLRPGSSQPCRGVLVVHHGLDAAFVTDGDTKPAPGYRLLHIAGSRDFLDRKGTPQLIQACRRLFGTAGFLRDLGTQIKITIRTPPGPHIEELLHTGQPTDQLFVLDTHTEPLSPVRMRRLLTMDPWTAVVQPSRAEAFGMVPLEARACGVPVALTAAAGHLEHYDPKVDSLITTGPEAPIKVNGIPWGQAPEVSVEHVEHGLVKLLRRPWRDGVLEGVDRAAYCRRWSWPAVTRGLFERLTAES